jgi:DNA repair exonuclease SbcCD ATPase subunit
MMTLVIRNIALDGFRKFRTPFAIEGLADGLNIVIEPNETGKSTLLDALRAAFFIRHNTSNALARSYAPHGEAVGPEVRVGFDVAGAPWSVTKRFLRGASVETDGPQGRAQGEEAEARLNALLGSVRDTSRTGDVASYGALGLLWVGQAQGLKVSAPGQIVRDTIASTLEAEVGSIMGGEAFRRVRQRVNTDYDLYWTPTGQKKGRQVESRDRADAAEAASAEASTRLAALERSFTELEATRGRLKSVDREVADETDIETRKALVASLEVARAAAQILATRTAEQEAASARLDGLADLKARHDDAAEAQEAATTALDTARTQRAALADSLSAAKTKAADARAALDTARDSRREARTALESGEVLLAQDRRTAAIAAARKRHDELLTLEAQLEAAETLADTIISAEWIAELEEHDRAVAAAQAIVDSGATRITLSGRADGITLDGAPMPLGERVLTAETRIAFGGAELMVSPPATAASAEETLASALRSRTEALDELEVADLAAARLRNEAARDAAAEVRTLTARIANVTPADERLALAAGAEALKLFITELADAEQGGATPADELPDIAALTEALETAELAAARAEGAHDSTVAALQRAEQEDAPLAIAEAGAVSDLANARSLVETIEGRAEWATLDVELPKAREAAAAASVKLEEAKRDATAHDEAAINRKIEIIDARARTSAQAQTKLEMEIARLQGTIESEGGLGLADRAAAAREEAEAAQAALQRVVEEAATIKLLHDMLEAARVETSAKFVGPVAKRAKRYIERLLPDCELSFTEDLALERVVRAGVDESCEVLSQGTQEQLAILTRIAFADLLLEQGRPVSLILDDPLVYSDDGRLDTMVEILSDVATRMQVILLTCRDRAFRHVQGNRLVWR